MGKYNGCRTKYSRWMTDDADEPIFEVELAISPLRDAVYELIASQDPTRRLTAGRSQDALQYRSRLIMAVRERSFWLSGAEHIIKKLQNSDLEKLVEIHNMRSFGYK